MNVGVDNEKGAFLTMEHIAKLGHKEIAFFKGTQVVRIQPIDGTVSAERRPRSVSEFSQS